MARPPWKPDADQARKLAKLKKAYVDRAAADTRYRELLAELAGEGVPIKALADEVGVERKTVYRHLGRSMT